MPHELPSSLCNQQLSHGAVRNAHGKQLQDVLDEKCRPSHGRPEDGRVSFVFAMRPRFSSSSILAKTRGWTFETGFWTGNMPLVSGQCL